MEPSRDTAGRRRRELLAKARELEEKYGPDQSRVVFEYRDPWCGWTMRRPESLNDQLREGHLMRNCLSRITEADPNVYSLRDPDNLPHLTPAVYRIEPEDNLDEVPAKFGSHLEIVAAGAALFIVDAARTGGLKQERRDQLVAYALHGNQDGWQRFPTTTRERLLAVLPFFNLPPSLQATMRAKINRTNPEGTLGAAVADPVRRVA